MSGVYSLTLGSLFVIVLAWDYRRYVLASMPVRRSEKAELAYTTKKIEANFSNFSAWHQRTKVLSSLWASGEVDRASSLQKGFVSPAPWFFSR
jgi:geranylgeranyl transferase type-2 subunit alpha